MQRRFVDRELSWLDFNLRVLEEVMDDSNPLLERVKFQSIFHSNLDEFFMNRVPRLMVQAESGVTIQSVDGLTPREQLQIIRRRFLDMSHLARRHFHTDILPKLHAAGVHLCNYEELTAEQRAAMTTYFERTVYPVLTPLAVDPGHPFPHISNLSINLAVLVRDRDGNERFARVKIPNVLPRLVPVPTDHPSGDEAQPRREYTFIWLEQLIAAHLGMLFRGVQVLQSDPFRVIRDADLEIRQDKSEDLLESIEQSLMRRRFGFVTQLLIREEMPRRVQNLLVENLEIEEADVYPVNGTLGLRDLMSLYGLDLPDLKDPLLRPRVPTALTPGADLFAAVRAHDIVLHHPYHSFTPVVEFLKSATTDPAVLALKQTIYRVGRNSPVIAALSEAVDEGKQVAVVVELKARFDEENNIGWARALENAGVHVVYGDLAFKVHCKVLLVVRREPDGIRRYVHLGTGNYNVRTARQYTDLGFFTCDPLIAEDVSMLFNALTGYSVHSGYRKLLVSPPGIRDGLLQRIEREIDQVKAGRAGKLCFKMNSITDNAIIEALYKASGAGVQVDLIVRSSCCLVPGVAGMSENIRVISIVGRFLEHSRIYYFNNGGQGQEEVLLGSADLMQRNLDRRVEILFPIDNPRLRAWLYQDVLLPHFKDNVKARQLMPDGSYKRLRPGPSEQPFSVQDWFVHHDAELAGKSVPEALPEATAFAAE